MRTTIAAALLLGGCTTTVGHMAQEPVSRTYQSAKARSAVVDCLLNRVSSDELTPQRTVAEHATTIAFTGHGLARKPAIYLFTVNDVTSGSLIEVRRYPGMSLATAETCF